MNFILFIFLSGGFSSDISDVTSNIEEVFMEPITDDSHKEEVINVTIPDDKNNQHYKDVKHYVFTTQVPNGTESEVTVSATTDVNFSVQNYKLFNDTTASPGEQPSETETLTTTESQNESAFWTMLVKALNETMKEEEGKDKLFQAVPSSDLNATNEEDKVPVQQDAKLKLMLGISLMTLLLFTLLLAISSALLYKLKTTYSKQPHPDEYPVNPKLANRSYYQPAEGISDTTVSKSADSSTLLNPSSKSAVTEDMTASDQYVNQLSDYNKQFEPVEYPVNLEQENLSYYQPAEDSLNPPPANTADSSTFSDQGQNLQ